MLLRHAISNPPKVPMKQYIKLLKTGLGILDF